MYHVELEKVAGFEVHPDRPSQVQYDVSNREVLVIESNTITRYPFPPGKPFSFIVEKKDVISAKFSPDSNFIALQHTPTQIECIHVTENTLYSKFMITCKKPGSTKILGYYWTHIDNLVLITTNGIELYQIPLGKKAEVKLIKEQKQSVNWYIYSAKHKLLLLSSGNLSNTLNGFHFTPNSLLKIPKFTIEKQDKVPLKPNEVVISQIYGKLYCIHIYGLKKEMTLYQLTREVVIKRQTIDLHTSDPVVLHSVDNLIVAHNTDSKVAMIFDIKGDTTFPVAAPLPLSLSEKFKNETNSEKIEFYGKQWEFHQPDLIIDKRENLVMQINVNLETLSVSFADKKKLVDFLLKRAGAAPILLNTLKSIIEECETLTTLSEIFDLLNSNQSEAIAKGHRRANSGSSPAVASPKHSSLDDLKRAYSDDWTHSSAVEAADDASASEDKLKVPNNPPTKIYDGKVLVDQEDMYTHVFLPIEEEKGLDFKYMVAVLTEYIRSLNFHRIPVEPFLYKLLINFLVRNNRFYQLHQLLQYHVVSDSVHVACQLLSLESTYPPAYQLALDMFKRLHTNDQILEVLLTKQQLISALRFIRKSKNVKVSPVRFLEACVGDNPTFYTVYKFFEQRKELTPECSKYTELFKMYFEKKP